MLSRLTYAAFFLCAGLALFLFVIKYEVVAMRDDLAVTVGQIKDSIQAQHLLRAEWAYVTSPQRLQAMMASQSAVALAFVNVASFDMIEKTEVANVAMAFDVKQ